MSNGFARPDWMQPTSAENVSFDDAFRCGIADRGLLAVYGTDAAAFLHSQLSSDLRNMAVHEVGLTSYSDARGRLLAVMRVFHTGDGFLLELPSDRIAPIATQLGRYVLRSNVRIQDVSADYTAFGTAGDQASNGIRDLLADAKPPITGQSIELDGGVRLAPLPGPRPGAGSRDRWMVFGPTDSVQPVWQALDSIPVAPCGWWDLLDIETGMPNVYSLTAAHFVAQMLNLDRLDALDFRKGCYPGQEIIARTRYLGRIKRRTYPLRAPDATAAPLPGDAVLNAETGNASGEIVSAADLPGGGIAALAVLHVDSLDAPLALADGTPAIRETPPYPLEETA